MDGKLLLSAGGGSLWSSAYTPSAARRIIGLVRRPTLVQPMYDLIQKIIYIYLFFNEKNPK